MIDRTAIYAAIDQERTYQDAKRGTVEQRNMPISEYIRILYAELREAKVSLDEGDQDAALCELLQVVSVGVACLQLHGVVTRAELERRMQT